MNGALRILAEEEGGYQPIVIRGRKIFDGWRECEQRWQAIRPYIKAKQTIVDIGSHYGFFSLMAAQERPSSFVWSIEGGSRRAEIQRQMLEANGLPNVLLSEHMVMPGDFESLATTCFTADVTLMLSVAHYFEYAELYRLLSAVAKVSPMLIIEYPSKDEGEVAQRERVQAIDIDHLIDKWFEHKEVIGNGKSPKHDDVGRTIYRAWNDHVEREGVSYIGNPTNKKHRLVYDKRWYIDGKARRWPGMTLENLRHFKLLYPNPIDTLRSAAEEYDDLIKERHGAVTDIHIRNVLMTPQGIRLIDTDEGVGQTIYDMPWETYVERTLSRDVDFHTDEFERMFAGRWAP